MKIDQQTLKQLEELIRHAAKEELLPRFQKIEREFKDDGSIVTEADHAMQARIITELEKLWPVIPLLGEEMTPAEQQALIDENTDGLWILDPLDGTSNFSSGIPCFSVSLALLVDHQIQFGLIYDPNHDECFSAIAAEGAWLNGEKLAQTPTSLPLSKCIAQLDFKRLPKKMAAEIASNPPYTSQRSFGSGALDWCWVAAGRVHIYLHGQQKLWDYSAGQLILREAGGHCCSLDSDTVFRGKMEPRSVIAALDTQHYDEWKTYVLGLAE